MVSLTRVSLSPFDLGSAANQVAYHCESFGFTRGDATWNTRLAGDSFEVYEANPNHRILIFRDGFGLNVRRMIREIEFSDTKQIARVLIDRGQYHRDIRSGIHPDANYMSELRNAASSEAHNKALRPRLWSWPPYTFSFFYIDAQPSEVSNSSLHNCHLAALLEPSQVLNSELLDDEADRETFCTTLISRLPGEDILGRAGNCDIRSGSVLYASWASLVMIDPHNDSLGYLEALEIRLQSAWMRAHYVRSFAESLIENDQMRLDPLVEFTTKALPLLRRSQRLLGGSVSTRDQRIFDKLSETSELTREIHAAEEAVEDVKTNIVAISSKRNRWFDSSIQALLVMLAVFQMYPILFKTPVLHLPTYAAYGPLVAGIIIVFALFWFRR